MLTNLRFGICDFLYLFLVSTGANSICFAVEVFESIEFEQVVYHDESYSIHPFIVSNMTHLCNPPFF